MTSQEEYRTRRVHVTNGLGLHARPAALLAQEAQKFSSEIMLSTGGQDVDAKSILDILTLAAGNGCDLEIKARGRDAEKALDHLVALFRKKFKED